MLVNNAATMQLESIQATAPIHEAAKQMRTNNIGLLLVSQDHNLIGVITDRDIVTRAVAEKDSLDGMLAQDVMSYPVVCIQCDAPLDEAAKLMSEKAVRRLVVLNDQKVPVGVLSVDDIAFYTHGNATAAKVLEGLAHGPQSAAIFRAG